MAFAAVYAPSRPMASRGRAEHAGAAVLSAAGRRLRAGTGRRLVKIVRLFPADRRHGSAPEPYGNCGHAHHRPCGQGTFRRGHAGCGAGVQALSAHAPQGHPRRLPEGATLYGSGAGHVPFARHAGGACLAGHCGKRIPLRSPLFGGGGRGLAVHAPDRAAVRPDPGLVV